MNSVEPDFWRLYLRAIGVTALILAADSLWLSLKGYNVGIASERAYNAYYFVVLFISIYVPCKILDTFGLFGEGLEKFRVREVANFFLICGLASLVVTATMIFQYICVAESAAGTIDDWLFLADRSLGFEWIDAYNWVNGHETIKKILTFAYFSHWQFPLCFLILSLARRHGELFELFDLFIISAILFSLISVAVPATSLFLYYNTKEGINVSDFYALRGVAGAKPEMNISQGLISFPSFHAYNAVIIPYALRSLAYVFPFALVLNILMLISTPTEGGHYLVDVISGVFFALLFISISYFRPVPLAGAHSAKISPHLPR